MKVLCLNNQTLRSVLLAPNDAATAAAWVLKNTNLLIIYLFLVGLEFELRAACLQTRHTTSWATHFAHFALVILEMGSWELFLRAGKELQPSFLISASQVARITGVSTMPSSIFFSLV
jgi:hypothetical protein